MIVEQLQQHLTRLCNEGWAGGQLKTRAAGKKLVTAAGAAPNSVAQVK